MDMAQCERGLYSTTKAVTKYRITWSSLCYKLSLIMSDYAIDDLMAVYKGDELKEYAMELLGIDKTKYLMQ